jgi:hypothetical protein
MIPNSLKISRGPSDCFQPLLFTLGGAFSGSNSAHALPYSSVLQSPYKEIICSNHPPGLELSGGIPLFRSSLAAFTTAVSKDGTFHCRQ